MGASPVGLRRRAMVDWYRAHRRDFPWRRTTSPYRILVSEVMCQQTQALRVVDRYERFVARFPDEAALSTAAAADVLTEWSGLGYNRRALNLQRAARHVVVEGWPRTAADLESLPGVGPYTAAAIACFAFGEPAAAIDTNLRRVLSRWVGISLQGTALRLAAAAEVDPVDPADWNQAIMDLGAMVCRPVAPDCAACPAAGWCVDPAIYEPPRPQGRFAGSRRQARGAVLRVLVESGPLRPVQLTHLTGLEEARLAPALQGLVDDRLVVEVDGRYELPTSIGAETKEGRVGAAGDVAPVRRRPRPQTDSGTRTDSPGEEVLEHRHTFGGEDALRVELDAMDRM